MHSSEIIRIGLTENGERYVGNPLPAASTDLSRHP
ncbi:hypothetical protein ABIA13_005191 [Sinorhizobium fredii]